MVQMWLLWWPKNTTTTTKLGSSTTSSTTVSTTSAPQNGSPNDSNCCRSSIKTLSKLVKKLKKHGSKMLRPGLGTKQSSFQCRYDPLSYSLNFDTSGCGSLADDEDYYYKFYAFSSRFVANRRPSSSPTLQAISSQESSNF